MGAKSSHDPRVRVAASAVVATGAIAAAKVVRDHAVQSRTAEQRNAFRLKRGETSREGIGRVARTQLDLTLGLLADGPRDDGGESVHEARKALKRLRALLRVSRPAIGDQHYRRENSTLRDVGRSLSGTRDAQVLLETLTALSSRYGKSLRAGTWSRLRDSLAADADQSRTIGSSRAAATLGVLTDTRGRVAAWPLPENGGVERLAPGLAQVYRRGRRAYRAASFDSQPETLHELRKRAKDLWHASQLLESIEPKRMKKLQRRAHQLSDLLGEDHDLAILRDHAERNRELLSDAEHELLCAVVEHRHQMLQRQGLECAAKLYRRKPKNLLRRLSLA